MTVQVGQALCPFSSLRNTCLQFWHDRLSSFLRHVPSLPQVSFSGSQKASGWPIALFPIIHCLGLMEGVGTMPGGEDQKGQPKLVPTELLLDYISVFLSQVLGPIKL